MTLRDAIAATGRPILTGEAPTFDGGDLETVRAGIAEMAEWVDAMNATDNTSAHAHASSVAVAIALQRLGVEPILQIVCRDRNRIAVQADIVGAALHGVTNVCCLTGDDVTAGDEPEARRVFDLDGPQLVRVASSIAEGRYLSGRRIDPAPALFVGAVENPGAPPLDHRADRARKKVAAGARFLQLQICFHGDRVARFAASLVDDGTADRVALLQTVILVKGARALRFIDAKVPGISVPQETIDRVERAADPSQAAYDLALEQARHALSVPGIRGLHLTDFRHDGAVSRLCRDLGIPTKEERRAHAYSASL